MAIEKTITIDGKEVTFKADGSTPIRYQASFQRDYFQDVIKLVGSMQSAVGKESDEIDISDIGELDSSILYNIIYTTAKTADKEIGTLIDWLSTFDEFPLFEVFGELQEILLANMHSQMKQVNSAKKKQETTKKK